MPYALELKKSAAKELDRLSGKTYNTVIKHLHSLEENPRPFGAEKLTGRTEFKLRVGNYRIVYEINDATQQIIVHMIDDRKQVYRRLRRL